jgi:hypothetical protein
MSVNVTALLNGGFKLETENAALGGVDGVTEVHEAAKPLYEKILSEVKTMYILPEFAVTLAGKLLPVALSKRGAAALVPLYILR